MKNAISQGAAFPELVACSRLVGQEFCDALVEALAGTLGVETVLLGRFHPDHPGRITTVAAWSKGFLVPSFEYDLAGSPCSRVMMDGTCHFADNVAAKFPEDVLLVEMAARGYVGAPLFSSNGRAVGVLAAVSEKPIDIGPEMMALLEIFASRAAAELDREASVSRSEYLGRLIDGSVSEVFVFDATTLRFILVNEGARTNLGYSMQELEHMSPLDLKPDFTREAFQALLEPLRRGHEPVLSFSMDHRRKDGSRYPVEVKLQMINRSGAPVFFAAIEDMTERAAVEQKLSATQERLQRLFAQSPAGILETDATGRLTLVNPTWCNMLGYTEAELLERTLFELTHPDSLPQTQQALQDLMAGAAAVTVEKNYVRKNGRSLAALSNVSALRGPDGAFMGIAAVISDVTERIAAEERIRKSEAHLRKILDGTLAFVGVLQPDGTLVEANATALVSSGLTRADVVGKKFWECHWWSHDPAVAQRLQDSIARAATGEVVRYDEVIRIKDDARITIDFMLTPYFADDGSVELLVPSGVDINDRKKQEVVLRDLMHEVNHRSKNILSVVQAIARQMPATEPAIFKRELGDRLRSLAACQDILVNNGWQSVQLSALIRSQLSHFDNLIGNRITVTGPDLKVSPAATQAISMAVYELTTNAAKYGALSNDKGCVEIRWHIAQQDGGPRFHLHWQERGGPAVPEPVGAGFGSTVLGHLVTGMLNGESTSTYDPSGYAWRLDCHPDALQSG
jgi:PAS domain S-box-containing protein